MNIKRIFAIGILFSFMAFAFAEKPRLPDEYQLSNVEDQYIGTYIPVDVENHLRKNKLFYKALAIGSNFHHDILLLEKTECYSDAGFHDGYAITAEEFKNYRFVKNNNGIFCIDQNGNSYKKISDKVSGAGYEAYTKHVMNILMSFAKDMKNIQIEGDEIVIDGVRYSVILDHNFFQTDNIAIWLRGKDGVYALVKNGVNGELHKGEQGEYREWYASKEKIKEFPLMFVSTEEDLPYYWDLPKEQYRYLRNLVYARHGYVFKSKDLKSFFEKFNWYKPNSKFSETELSRDEKSYIERMLENENKSK